MKLEWIRAAVMSVMMFCLIMGWLAPTIVLLLAATVLTIVISRGNAPQEPPAE